METDNFAHIINERKKRYAAYARWEHESEVLYKKVKSWLEIFVVVSSCIVIYKVISTLFFF